MITRTKSPSRSQSNSERNLQTNKSLVSGYYQTTPARKLTVNSKRLAKRKKRRKTYEQRPQSRRHFSQEGVPCFLVHPVSSRGERWNNNGADWRQAARPLQYATRQQHSTLSSIPCQQLPLHSWNARREPIYLSRKQRASSSQLPISLLFPCCSSPRRVLSPPSTYGHLLILAHRAEIHGINDSIFCGRILVQRSDTSKAKRNSFEGGRTHVRSSCAPSGINQTKRAARGRADNMWRGVVQQQTKQKKWGV